MPLIFCSGGHYVLAIKEINGPQNEITIGAGGSAGSTFFPSRLFWQFREF